MEKPIETPLVHEDEIPQRLTKSQLDELYFHTEQEISNKSIKYFIKYNISFENVLRKAEIHHVGEDFVFHYVFGLAFKNFLIDVMAELYGTPADRIDQNKLCDIDPCSETFMDNVKDLLTMTKNLEVDEDKPLTYRLLKQIEANMVLNKKRSALQSLYQLKMLSKEKNRLIVFDINNNFVLSHELNEDGGCSQDENKPESPDKPLS